MKTLCSALWDIARDERGVEAVDYALVIGLIVVAALSVMSSVGVRVLARWTSLDNAM